MAPSVETTATVIAEKITGRQIINSRGRPTVEVDVKTTNGVSRAAVPSGSSVGAYEAVELLDGDSKMYNGYGVLNAVNFVNSVIGPAIASEKKLNLGDQKALDDKMIALDGTKNKSKLGANAILGVSLAAARAYSKGAKIPLYKHIADLSRTSSEGLSMPMPYFNLINGGKHAGNQLPVQEFMAIPTGAKTFSEAMRMGCELYSSLRKVLTEKYGQTAVNVGDEGGFAPPVSETSEALTLLTKAIDAAGYNGKIKIGLDVAASEFYVNGKYDLTFKKPQGDSSPRKVLSSDELSAFYVELMDKFPIVSFEDPFHENDIAAWAKFMQYSSRVQIVGDDLLATNPERIEMAIAKNLCNTLLLKPNQIGTLSETIQAAKLAQQGGMNVIVSHRSGETEDTFIADLAVGLAAGQIKAGAPCRSERLAKYNQLLRVEEELALSQNPNKTLDTATKPKLSASLTRFSAYASK